MKKLVGVIQSQTTIRGGYAASIADNIQLSWHPLPAPSLSVAAAAAATAAALLPYMYMPRIHVH